MAYFDYLLPNLTIQVPIVFLSDTWQAVISNEILYY
jgi:hypothetical protein